MLSIHMLLYKEKKKVTRQENIVLNQLYMNISEVALWLSL